MREIHILRVKKDEHIQKKIKMDKAIDR